MKGFCKFENRIYSNGLTEHQERIIWVMLGRQKIFKYNLKFGADCVLYIV